MTFYEPEHVFDIIPDQKVLKTNYFYSVLVEIEFSPVVVSRGKIVPVNLAIEFDSKPLFDAIEIQYIRSDTVLATELAAV